MLMYHKVIGLFSPLTAQDSRENRCITTEGRKREKCDVAKLLGHPVVMEVGSLDLTR